MPFTVHFSSNPITPNNKIQLLGGYFEPLRCVPSHNQTVTVKPLISAIIPKTQNLNKNNINLIKIK